jgi:hypothetical protein
MGNDQAGRADSYKSERSSTNTTAYILWFFLGAVGGHRFYLESPGMGFIELICCVGGVIVLVIQLSSPGGGRDVPILGVAMIFTGSIMLLADLCLIPELIKDYYDKKFDRENKVYVQSSAPSLSRPLLTHPAMVNNNTYNGRSDFRGSQYNTGGTSAVLYQAATARYTGGQQEHLNSSSNHHVAVSMPCPADAYARPAKYSPFPTPASPSYDKEFESLKQFLDSINVPSEVFRKLVDSRVTLITLPLMSTGDFKDIGISIGYKLQIMNGLQQRENVSLLNPEMGA